MGDERLNSVHLDGSRKQLFRHAREGLLDARGQQTVFVENQQSDSGQYPHTVIQGEDAQKALLLEYWLQDHEDCIYPLKVGVNTVGRSDDNDVVVPDSYVSRRHCAILVHATTGCELHDIASKNGTFINGARLGAPIRLKPGDEIRMCGCTFHFRSRHESKSKHANTNTLSA